METQHMASVLPGRRDAMKLAVVGALAGTAILATTQSARAQSASDIDALNLALQFLYLEGQYLSYVATGGSMPTALLTGTGVPGTVTPGRRLTFADAGVNSIFAEMAAETRLPISPIRVLIGALASAQPAIDISASATGAFSVAMQRAGVVAAGAAFDAYASEENVLYATYFLKDIGVSLLRGILPSISNRVVVQLLVGLLATESQHAAVVRSLLYTRGATTDRLRQNALRIATFRRSLGGGAAIDEGVAPVQQSYTASSGTVTVQTANITPANGSGEVLGRTPGQVLNLLFLSTTVATQGGFYPAGLNGAIRTSAGA